MFALALPLGLLVLGLLGLWAVVSGRLTVVSCQLSADNGRRQASTDNCQLTTVNCQLTTAYWLVMGSLCFVLIAFSWPGRPMYDGVRLFLMAFPLWAISVGLGAKWLAGQWPLAAGLIRCASGLSRRSWLPRGSA